MDEGKEPAITLSRVGETDSGRAVFEVPAPDPLPPSQLPPSQRLLQNHYVRMAIAAAVILCLPIAAEIAFLNFRGAAKIIISYVMLFGAVFGFAIVFARPLIMEKLELLEQLADVLRDESSLQLQAVSHRLNDVNERMFHKKETTEEILPDFLKTLGPVAMMLLKRERNIIQWSLTGAKFVKSALDLWKAQTKK
ncbi:MAG TPA: hypothetical protein V6D17_15365 [Candidatus Obscuribacterales bacterium]